MLQVKPTYDTDSRKNLVVSEVLDLHSYRALLLHLIRRNLTARYKRSILGVAWTLLDPLATMLIMAIIFSAFFGQSVKYYPVYILSGLVIWNFILQASTSAITDLVGGSWLRGKVYLPRTIFAVVAIGTSAVNLLIALIPLTVLIFFFQVPITPALLFLPVAMVVNSIFALGLGLLFSAFSVMFADMLNIHTILMRLLMYLSGIFYFVDSMPVSFRPIIILNPLYSLLELFRDPIYYGALPAPWTILYGSIWAVLLFCLGLFVFLRFSDQIAYRL